jgi:hypothetical protein
MADDRRWRRSGDDWPVIFVLALFKMGNAENYEFIYFQF